MSQPTSSTPSTPRPGDRIAATVTHVLTTAVLVDSESGMPGLVAGAIPAVGETVTVTVTSVDDVNHRFTGTVAG